MKPENEEKNKKCPIGIHDLLAVGDVLYRLNVGNAARLCEQKLDAVTVTQLGRKYFTCRVVGDSYPRETRFLISNRKEDCKGSESYKLYSSPQEWEDEKEAARLHVQIRDRVINKWSDPIPLKTLRAISNLLANAEAIYGATLRAKNPNQQTETNHE